METKPRMNGDNEFWFGLILMCLGVSISLLGLAIFANTGFLTSGNAVIAIGFEIWGPTFFISGAVFVASSGVVRNTGTETQR